MATASTDIALPTPDRNYLPETEEELWRPLPAYVDLFRRHPECAATVARELFDEGDCRFLPFMLSFPWSEDANMLPEVLHSNFLVALLDLVTNPLWYELLDGLASTRNYGGTEQIGDSNFAHSLYLTLGCLDRLILVRQGKVLRPNAQLCDLCIQRFPALWESLWKHRDIILKSSFTRSNAGGNLRCYLASLMRSYFHMFRNLRSAFPPITSHLCHVAFYLWHARGEETWPTHEFAVIGIDSLEGQPSAKVMVEFLKGVVPTVIGSDNLFDILCDVLLTADKDLMQPAYLECNLNMLVYSFRVVDCSGLQLSAETRRKALFALCRVFQRYQCSQWGMVGFPMASQKISTLILDNLLYLSQHDQMGVQGDIIRDVFDLNFIPVIAASVIYVYTITWRQPLLRGLIEVLIEMYTQYGLRMGERNCSHIRRILHVHWLPVRQDLRTALKEAERLHAPDSLEVIDLRDVTGKWEKLGSTYRLSRRSRDDDSVQSLISYLTPEERTQGCYLRECPCYGRKSPWHKARRGCKGCWTVFYCSKQCQKRDWQLGHRDICPGRK